ncbi:MAG: ferritin family protein [Coriobacteriia bacterium]|nr:ferritin family protein [Coriobacteriia bacterium]
MEDVTVSHLFEQAISWETTAQDLYVGLSKSFPSYPVVEDIWRRMAIDESRHAAILREAAAALPPSCLARLLDATEIALVVSVEAEHAGAAALELRTLDDAYELAHRLESSEVNTVFQLLISCHADDLAANALLEAQFDEHLDRLGRLAKAFSRPVRQGIALQT